MSRAFSLHAAERHAGDTLVRVVTIAGFLIAHDRKRDLPGHIADHLARALRARLARRTR